MRVIEHYHCGTKVFDTCPVCGKTGLYAEALEAQELNTPLLEGPVEEVAAEGKTEETVAPKRGRKPAAQE